MIYVYHFSATYYESGRATKSMDGIAELTGLISAMSDYQTLKKWICEEKDLPVNYTDLAINSLSYLTSYED